jgi:chemotaxis-related protein WspD
MTELTDDQSANHQRSAALKLLDREAPAEYVSEWTTHVAAGKNAAEPGTKSVVIFRIDKEWLALSTDVFQEVTDHGTIRTLPDRRWGIVRGLINVRGELLLCVALETLLGMERVAARMPKDRLLIVGHGSGRFAVQVNEVFGVHRYHPNELRLAPAILLKASSGSYTVGILRWKGTTVACLDEALLFSALSKGLA